MSRGNPLSDELELSSVLGDVRAYLGSPQSRKVTFLVTRVDDQNTSVFFVHVSLFCEARLKPIAASAT